MAASLKQPVVLRICRNAQRMPDGAPMPSELGHALIVLATYWPNIWPSQDTLARDMKISRRAVNYRLRRLEDAGLIVRTQRGDASTRYSLCLRAIRALE